MDRIIQWATDPWGQSVPIHIAWFLIWVAAIGGLLFLMVHAAYVRYFARARRFAKDDPTDIASRLPERIPRHSLAARLFHWIMAASMLTLLFTAFLPKPNVFIDDQSAAAWPRSILVHPSSCSGRSLDDYRGQLR